MTIKLILFGTEGCHLCEQAREIVDAAISQWPYTAIVDYVDVCDDNQERWQKLYALKIPVLFHEVSGQELFWPFTETDVLELLITIQQSS